ncbi:DNA polymerase III subunit alpha [Dactylosporangium sp. CA-139066]|uniref:DNA polymerase III subunit alpha n=1 Tax=Dactylosporangium sp. CA-139066 TaxID=3239930 RepID=UPI003D8D9D58
MKQFVHLHVHTDYSMLDGAARLGPLFAEVNRLGQPAIAITDHGNMFGAYEFHKQALAAGVKPILGMEAYLTPNTPRQDRTRVRWNDGGEDDVSGGGAYTHMTLLAENAEGLRNLFRLQSLASLEGTYYKPRADRELLQRCAKGLIATTGCLGGEVQTWLRIGNIERARQSAGEFRDIFGRGNFFLEVMDHGIAKERAIRGALLDIGRYVGIEPVATNDSHYVTAADAGTHAALLCVQSGSTLDEPKFSFDGAGYHIKSAEEMRAYWDIELPGACDATLSITERVGDYSSVFAARNLMPRVEVPPGHNEDSWLEHEVRKGLLRRNLGGAEVHARARFELDTIARMGFPGYFLVVADIVGHAKSKGIRVGPGRGSAAGSLVAYALGITDLDPMAHGLMFERFLNPDRVSPPDIDLDFDERHRGYMIEYATQRYGAEYVAQIATFGTIKSRAAVKDAARVLGKPYMLGERIVAGLPPVIMGKDTPLAKVISDSPKREAVATRAAYAADPEVRAVIDTALGLEGLKRSVGVHAAGVILSREPLLDVLPIWQRPADGAIVTSWDMTACESIGLLKMDFLGLRNLTVIEDALASIRANRGIELELETLPLTDRKTYAMLARGETLGVFQLDSPGITGLLTSMVPTCFEDISAVLALYRPGPMGVGAHTDYAHRKNGRQEITPIHPELEEPLADILSETYGLIVYQEQVMAIAQRVAGYTLAQADLLRRAMGKKKKEVLDAEYPGFEAGMRENGYSYEATSALWEVLVPFSEYAFNKAHTAGYGLVSYWTAYLKANYPAEYMAALLTSVGDDREKLTAYLSATEAMGIKVMSPDVNESGLSFTPVGRSIRFGLAAIRNVGAGVVEAIMAARQDRKFSSFFDFLRRVPPAVLNKKTVESLIKAGAFDSLGQPRKGLADMASDAIDQVLPRKRAEESGQFDLLAERLGAGASAHARPDPEAPGDEWSRPDLMQHEEEMLGLCVSDPPNFPAYTVDVPAEACTPTMLARLHGVLAMHPGAADVRLRLVQGARSTLLAVPLAVEPSPVLSAALKVCLDSPRA